MYLTSPKALRDEIPLSEKGRAFVAQSRLELIEILERKVPRLFLAVGPCSIHHIEEALEYAEKLKSLQNEVKDSVFIAMRAYVEKPRTKIGWKGLVHDPHLNGSDDLDCGLRMSRSLLSQLVEMEIPAATEFLTTHLAPYLEDLITWGCIGARTSSSQTHRLLASSLPMPIGFKNSVDGNILTAIHGAHFAREPHSFLHISDEGRIQKCTSSGNPYCHVVLRGNDQETNFDRVTIQKTLGELRSHEMPPRVFVDCSHGNCRKQFSRQKDALMHVLEQIQEGNTQIFGMMLESNLEAGSQTIPRNLADLQSGVSITDPCLDYSETAELIRLVSSSMSTTLTHS